jgi:site-specific DNA recombinase
VKNLKSQVARLHRPDSAREAELTEQIAAGESRAAELKREVVVRERGRVNDDELRETVEPFEELWKAMNIQEQSLLLRQLVEKVGYEGRTGKITVSFKSASVKELCQK